MSLELLTYAALYHPKDDAFWQCELFFITSHRVVLFSDAGEKYLFSLSTYKLKKSTSDDDYVYSITKEHHQKYYGRRCCSLLPDYDAKAIIGNIREDNIETIWKSEKMNTL